jgi:hypothetical protein
MRQWYCLHHNPDKEDNTIDALRYNPEKEDNTIDALRYNPDKEDNTIDTLRYNHVLRQWYCLLYPDYNVMRQ